MDLLVLLFNEFETLDVFGPVEILGKLEAIKNIRFISVNGGLIISSQQVPVLTTKFASLESGDCVFLIPGGIGTRKEVNNIEILHVIKQLSENARFVLSVCTGSALLAKTGMLDGKEATTNKRAYNWVIQQNSNVKWIKEAHWVKDGNIYTSSGVSAGIDMALGFVADNFGIEKAEEIAIGIEYIWNKNSEEDIFSSFY